MDAVRSPTIEGEAGPVPKQRLQVLCELLLEAWHCAADVHCELWQFAVEKSALEAAGANPSELRWLRAKGLIESRLETTGEQDRLRTFRTIASLAFPERTCFVLTQEGYEFAQALIQPSVTSSTNSVPVASKPATSGTKPSWDSERRELWFDGVLVKQYRVPADLQEAVLNAFERSGWPRCIKAPPEIAQGQRGKHRLQRAVRCLNRNQKVRVMYFRGDGTARRVIWEYSAAAAGNRRADLS